jgi:ribosomal protein S15P/S13E
MRARVTDDPPLTHISVSSVRLCLTRARVDLYMLIKKAVSVRKHLDRNRKDKDAKFRLILIESRIHRLARYYKTTAQVPANWKYGQTVVA